MKDIIIQHAKQGNLNDLSLSLPKNKLIVFTGISGSGKSTLAIDTIFNEAQRQYLEALGMQGIHKPDVEFIRNLSPSVCITQKDYQKNPRSSVGTATDIYTDLRMLYEKLCIRECPNCLKKITPYSCKEEVIKVDQDFKVYMYCNHCGHKMDKLTRTYFSYNTREGACPSCEGLGHMIRLQEQKLLHEELSLEDGACAYWEGRYQEYQIDILYKACLHYHEEIKPNTAVKHYTELQKAILKYGVGSKEVNMITNMEPPKTVKDGKFEGIFTTIKRRMAEKGGVTKHLETYFEEVPCEECHGERLNALSRSVIVHNTRLPQLVQYSLSELYQWLKQLEKSLSDEELMHVQHYVLDLQTKLIRLINVGLSYLSLDRQTMTLSGGEAQRMKLAATLDSDLTGIIYIMDEPTMGLHSKDTEGIIAILKKLRDLGNTVIVIEHDMDVIKAADYIVDIGPGAGIHGGNIIAAGSLHDLMQHPTSLTGMYLKKPTDFMKHPRKGSGQFMSIKNASLHNLKSINVNFPIGCLTCVTGVSGSGKSSLVFGVLAKSNMEGMSSFDHVTTIEQSQVARMKRSNVATYSGVYTEIRSIFANLEQSKRCGYSHRDFSFNSKGGRCENCEGLGVVTSNMLFFQDIDIPCPICNGQQFHEDILSITYHNYNIHQILTLSVEDALEIFAEFPKVVRILTLLQDVGLGYLKLGQTLTTLSGGEGQRLKLARELINQNKNSHILYLIDEPTIGLHPFDIDKFLILLNQLVDTGNTVIVVEHNQQLINHADWIIDLGPEGGIDGGQVIAEGTPDMLRNNKNSVTGSYI